MAACLHGYEAQHRSELTSEFVDYPRRLAGCARMPHRTGDLTKSHTR
ncbi:MAG: hypothetical protein H6832_03410 [Planctomycetes bacterium]|nr:hypothetical protein [Planctomycetota bacterium]